MGGRVVAETFALAILDVFLQTEFEGGRHVPRLEGIKRIEQEECGG
jgi:ribose 5-phosphate isomerase RpiB